ncbi:PREDICTED: uncharacterized protein LOC109582035 isoform X1 [Amphimedon queenslandica]|uniref:NudC domain-containing protein 1 n=1 Tax=Amphimedon queenslandica TaxID=400682 RepID=A0A1X7UVR2_AMPQE|nr:PREDICTED: uncharacterized protein LOC109582035 isoform X1 [Amphimedon queenslandica]|eukprot:XP_019852155.1 PREDICTED: uncharacterized protein LOC109582035 isoform X1 [Amphimedon queenslandica]
MMLQLEDTSAKYCTCVWWRVCLSDRLGSSNIEVVSQTQLCRFKGNIVLLYSEYINECLLLVSESVPGIDREEKEVNEDKEGDWNTNQDTMEYNRGTASTSWNQSSSDINISIMIPEDVNKSDIVCIMESTSISVGLSDGTTYIRGDLLYNIDECTSTWTYSKGKLDIMLEKMADDVEWSSLFKDGSFLPLDDESKEIKRKRSTLVGGGCGSPSKYSKQSLITNSLEECDTDDDQDINVYLINNNGFIVQKVLIN